MDNTALLLITILLISVLGIILSVVAYSYRQLIRKYYVLRDELDREKKAGKAEADKIIAEAEVRAKEIIAEGTVFNQKLQENLSEELKNASAAQAENYQAILKTAQDEVVKTVSSMSESVKSQILQEFKSFTAEATTQVQKELQAYKAEAGKRVDESIFEVVSTVTREAIGKSLNLSDQEELIINALEKAKAENSL